MYILDMEINYILILSFSAPINVIRVKNKLNAVLPSFRWAWGVPRMGAGKFKVQFI